VFGRGVRPRGDNSDHRGQRVYDGSALAVLYQGGNSTVHVKINLPYTKINKNEKKGNSDCLLRIVVFRVSCSSECLFFNGQFIYCDLKLDLSTLFATFYLPISQHLIFFGYVGILSRY